ncbi:OmpA family protein [Granulicella mallensis]|uniref:PKD/Chitinase domain-containing protein n=1 Tax=Granulicella mallensis (strain ATCC BAA-1857 / DSM 23137 / MP5ACTX8) TaxID=682795 RepID=G8NUT0_GRAMM|nr:hypothetical protein [Granulicella mallensis]AEU37620.1 PKD/Chitinase domain-containing protein [Granulicella mallensis MP5ACTX8]
MSYRPFRSIGRCLLAASAVSFGIVSLSAQTAPSTTAPSGPNPSRVDLFVGYSYFGAHGEVKPSDIPYSSINVGAIGSGAYYFNKYVGGEVIYVSHHGFGGDGGQSNDGFDSLSAGPIFRAPMQNFTLFAHGLVGVGRLLGPNNDNFAQFEHEPWTYGPALTVGGGMDYDTPLFHHHLGIRLFQADFRYVHADFGPVATTVTPPFTTVPPVYGTPWLGGRANLNGVDLSTGILWHIGSVVPPPPVTYACAVTAPTGPIYPGDVVTITGTSTNLAPKGKTNYTWTSDSGPVSGSADVASIDTKSLQPGNYTVKGKISQGNKVYQNAECSAQFTVTPFAPPTVGCSANPSTVNPGDPSTITASGVSPQNRPLTYSYSATAGSISGNTSTATLTTAGVAPGTVTVTCNVVDDKGQSASQMTTVTVAAPVVAPTPVTTSSLCTIAFNRDEKRPTRVDNEAKACLDDIALSAQRDPQAKLAVIGNAAANEKMAEHKAAERAVNEKAYLVTEKGVDSSRISVYTGSAGDKSAATTIIPVGATLDTTGLTPVDESAIKVQPRKSLGAGHRHHHKG